MLNLGIDKGYKFLLHTGNMFFVRDDLFKKLNIDYKNELENFTTEWAVYKIQTQFSRNKSFVELLHFGPNQTFG